MEEIFKKINTDYQILIDPKSRSNYDLSIATKTISYPSSAPKKKNNPYKYYSRGSHFRAYKTAEIDYKEIRISSLYAFGFVFIIDLLVVSIRYTRCITRRYSLKN